MNRPVALLAFAALSLALAPSCVGVGDDDDDTGEGEGDEGEGEEGEGEEGEGEEGEGEEGEGEEGEGEEGEGEDLGFPLRTPGTVTLDCEIDDFFCPDGTAEAQQVDTVCTLTELDAVIYVQANPTSMSAFNFPFFEDVRAFVHDNATGVTLEVSGAYDWGGNHHNDFVDVALADGTRRFNHSSYGFGFRVCQPPDCVQTLVDGEVVDDGCTSARTRPEVCAPVIDGTLPPLDVDSFERCAGDPNGE